MTRIRVLIFWISLLAAGVAHAQVNDYFEKGLAFEKSFQVKDALAAYELTLLKYPNHAEAMIHTSRMLSNLAGKLPKSEDVKKKELLNQARSYAQKSIGDAEIHLTTHVVVRAGQAHQISFYEVELLRLLHERTGQPVSRDEILQKIWGLDAAPSNRTVDNFIVKLRKKIEKTPDKPERILTVYGYGYMLTP